MKYWIVLKDPTEEDLNRFKSLAIVLGIEFEIQQCSEEAVTTSCEWVLEDFDE